MAFSNKERPKTILLLLILVVTAATSCQRKPSLDNLQSNILAAKTDEERAIVVEQLEEYYLTLDIPDSIRQDVDTQVVALLQDTEIDTNAHSRDGWHKGNPYELEYDLEALLKTAMIARAREELLSFQKILIHAEEMAQVVDERTKNKYWVPFVDQMNGYSKDNAIAWLKANTAARICQDYHGQVQYWRPAEHYGSLALNQLTGVNDERISLSVMQRFQRILYFSRGKTELSIALANSILERATEINQPLRVLAVTYHKAQAFHQGEQPELALDVFQKVIDHAELNSELPYVSWYKKQAYIGMAGASWHFGHYSKAISIHKEIELYELTDTERMLLHNEKGLVQQRLGNYDAAELEYETALALADSNNNIYNRFQFMKNLGHMYYQLSEYDKALEYYTQMKNLLKKFDMENSEHSMDLLLDMDFVNTLARDNNSEFLNDFIKEATESMQRTSGQSLQKAFLLFTIGRLNFQIGNYHQALENFKDAEDIYTRKEFIQQELQVKVDLANTMIRLNRTTEAREQSLKVLESAENIDEYERVIDATALLAEIAYQEGDINSAIKLSNQLISKIERLSAGFVNSDRLTSYRQKIYDYLKKAIVYEIHYDRIDSAFVKLDYAKARALKEPDKTNANGKIDASTFIDLEATKRNLDERVLVVDYLFTKDTLYAFVLSHGKLSVLSKDVNMNTLRNLAYRYKDNIKRTADIFGNYTQAKADDHFHQTNKMAYDLFRNLLGWQELRMQVDKVERLYIIPDEFLFEVPFATLALNVADSLTYLIDKVAVTTTASASLINASNGYTKTQNYENKRVLISANPNIPGVHSLVSFLRNVFPLAEELKIGRDPTKQDVLDKLSEGHDIHIIVGHGIANATFPEQSNIEFTMTNSVTLVPKTFQVTISDLENLNWSGSEMVFLVGCDTGSGKLYRGTGIAGLQLSFISLGAQNVLATQWKIDAVHAVPQVITLVQTWVTSSDLALALKRTQQGAIQRLQQNTYYRFPHPYYWGSYNLLYR